MKKLAFSALALGALSLSVACGGDDGGTVDLPDAAPDAQTIDSGGNGAVCNAITNGGCQAGEKCGVRFITDNPDAPGTTECMADGAVAIGGACAFADDPAVAGTTIDNCMASAGQGVFCRSSICTEVCAAGAAGTCPDRGAAPQSCVRLSGVFDDQATAAGVCALQCTPLDVGSCNAGEGCYLLPFDMESEFICANAAVPDPAPTAGFPCPPDAPGGGCFLNGSGPGSTIVSNNADVQGSVGVIAPYCIPANTSIDVGVSSDTDGNALTPAVAEIGDPAGDGGITLLCNTANLGAGGNVGGNGTPANFGCRFYDSSFSNTGNLPDTFGFCAPQNGNAIGLGGSSGWNQGSVWSLQVLVDDIADNDQIDTPETSLCFGCVSSAVLDAALARRGGPAFARKGMATWRSHLPTLPAEELKKLRSRVGTR